MSIALIFGSSGPETAKGLIDTGDLRNIEAFSSLSDLMDKMARQGYAPDRILILSQQVPNYSVLEGLGNYLKQSNLPTEVVLIARGYVSHDLEVISWFERATPSPLWSDYCIKAGEQFDFASVRSIIGYSIDHIRTNHSSYSSQSVSVQGREAIKEEKTPVSERLPIRVSSAEQVKSFSFGGRFFGKGNYTKNEKIEIKQLLVQVKGLVD